MSTSVMQKSPAVAIPSGLASISLPMRDREETKRFYKDVLCGELLEDDGKTLKFWFENFALNLVPQNGGGTPVGAEYPHCAFSVTPEQFYAIKLRLDGYGVPTGEPWTRSGVALMYFRDPSDNQWELYSKSGCPAVKLRQAAAKGGDYSTDFHALSYKKLKNPTTDLPQASTSGFNHFTLAIRNMEETERFQTIVLGGVVTHPGPSHLTVEIGGVSVGAHETDKGWTAEDAEYPHYTYKVTPDALIAIKRQLEAYGVPTHDIATHDGVDAWMYYRDPSGSLWELNCPQGFTQPTRRVASAGGDFKVDVKALNYSKWKDPGR
jgi:catechol 2,3-dioxygenase-like lactoylglutathione lyase family enzyme